MLHGLGLQALAPKKKKINLGCFCPYQNPARTTESQEKYAFYVDIYLHAIHLQYVASTFAIITLWQF